MVLGKAVVVAMEAVAAFHVASVCVESVFEAVELRLSVSTSSFLESDHHFPRDAATSAHTPASAPCSGSGKRTGQAIQPNISRHQVEAIVKAVTALH